MGTVTHLDEKAKVAILLDMPPVNGSRELLLNCCDLVWQAALTKVCLSVSVSVPQSVIECVCAYVCLGVLVSGCLGVVFLCACVSVCLCVCVCVLSNYI